MFASPPDDAQRRQLLQCVEQNDLAALQRLCQCGADFHFSALHQICCWSNPDGITQKADLKRQNEVFSADGLTPLHVAAIHGHVEIARFLLSCRVKLDAQDAAGYTPLAHAARHNRVELLRELLAHGADCSLATAEGFTPLHLALRHSRKNWYEERDAAVLLLRAHAPLVNAGPRGRSPLHVAAQRGWHAFFVYLLRNGEFPDARDADGRSPLHLAPHKDGGTTIRRLLQEGASPSPQSYAGLSPLGEALFAHSLPRLRCLIRSGIPIDDPCWFSYTPRALCSLWQDDALWRFLQSEAAAPPTPLPAAEKRRLHDRRLSHTPASPPVLFYAHGHALRQSQEQCDANALRLSLRRSHPVY